MSTYFLLGRSEKTKINPILPSQNQQATASASLQNTSQKLSVLLLGYGGGDHDGGALTDSIILLATDSENKTASLVSIPRDLWIEDLGNKINEAYPEGGDAKSKSIVSRVVGVPIDYFVSVDFSGFEKIINTLGGIEVNVPKTFTDNFYPLKGEENNTCGYTQGEINSLKTKYSGFELEKQFTCRYEILHFDKGPITLSGADSLKFVRSRHGDSDFGRSERQSAVLEGLVQKLISLKALQNSGPIIDTLLGMVTTDMDLSIINHLLPLLANPDGYKLSQVHLTEDNVLASSINSIGQFILLPKAGDNNFSQIQTYIKESTQPQ